MTASDDPFGPAEDPRAYRRRDADSRRTRREHAHRQAVRRRRGAGMALVAVIGVAVVLLAGVGGGSSAVRSSPVVRSGPLAGVPRTASLPTSAPRRAAPIRRAAPSPGSLPQTHAYPSGTSAQFRSLMASLWAGIVSNRLYPAMTAFFPKGAYEQLKAIASASSDWTDRLVHDYGLDIAAAHELLGHDATHARLVAVNVPSSYGHWIEPGVCYNSIGYYELPNARMVYREDGQIRSVGIASMISWRGVWYVVHLGAVLRSTDAGTVDEPSSGPGSSAYSGTC
jgi:hypothetical protein